MPNNADVAVVLNPQLSVLEFLATICEELHIDVTHNRGSIKAQTDALNRHLLDAHSEGRRTILIVDEAQNLSPAVLEQVRLLTNLETAKQKLLQIILIGQPELRELLARNDLRQLAQRITGRYHLEPLTREETAQYIEHRLKVAGALGEVFDSGAKKSVFRFSQGVPRLINVICDRALLGAYSEESRRVNRRLVRRAAAEVSGELERPAWLRPALATAAVVGVAIIAASIWSYTQQSADKSSEALLDGPAAAVAAEPQATELTAEPAQPKPEPDAEATVEPIAPAADTPALNEQLQMGSALTTTASAFTSLFEAWGLEYQASTQSGCSQANAAGLVCLYQRGSWSGLKQMDRPAILTLVDDAGETHEVLLTAVRGDVVELSIGGILVEHPVSSLLESWFGQYLLLWRPPGGVPVSLGRGARNESVVWLRTSLAAIDPGYTSANQESNFFDAELEELVRRFQRDHRLSVDGVAGQQTQIVINSLLAVDGTPRLTRD